MLMSRRNVRKECAVKKKLKDRCKMEQGWKKGRAERVREPLECEGGMERWSEGGCGSWF